MKCASVERYFLAFDWIADSADGADILYDFLYRLLIAREVAIDALALDWVAGYAYIHIIVSLKALHDVGNQFLIKEEVAVHPLRGIGSLDVVDFHVPGGLVVENRTFNTPYYNMQGMKVSRPGKGLYIHNGTKVRVK